MPRDGVQRSARVGGLVLTAAAVLALGVFLIGEQNNLFRPMNHYWVAFEAVSGLQAGNPVQLNGVAVGRVEEIVLPEDPSIHRLRVRIAVDARYAERVRKDSQARIKTLGLLGDKYVELTSGSAEVPAVADGGDIGAAPETDVDRLISSGEDAVENIVAISVSLRRILERMERGDGLLGQLIAPLPESASERPILVTVQDAVERVDRIAADLENGRGPLGRLLYDEEMGDRLASSLVRLESVLEAAEEGDGLVAGLLHDETARQKFDTTLENLLQTSERLSALAVELETGEGVVPRLIHDEAYADEVLSQLRDLVARLDTAAEEITAGDGTAARLIQDPSVYEAIQDIVIGVEESRLLRWLVRNRQKAGIEKRYEEAQEKAAEAAGEPDGEGSP